MLNNLFHSTLFQHYSERLDLMGHNGPMNAWIPEQVTAFVARLESAERRIYPLAMTDTDRYQRSVTLVGMLSRHLDGCGASAQELEHLRPTALIRLRGIASEQAIVLVDLDEEALVDAGLAQRYRILRAESAAHSADLAMEEARAAGESWLGLEAPDASTMGFAMEQRWVDVHLATGTRLLRTVTPDPLSGHAKFRIELRSPGANDSTLVINLEDRQEWLDEAAALRQAVDSQHVEKISQKFTDDNVSSLMMNPRAVITPFNSPAPEE